MSFAANFCKLTHGRRPKSYLSHSLLLMRACTEHSSPVPVYRRVKSGFRVTCASGCT